MPPEYFVDRNLGKHEVILALRECGARVVVHDEHFAQAASDAEWLAEAGRQGWYVITKDSRIRYRPAERHALIQAGVGAFVIRAAGLKGKELAQLIRDRWVDIESVRSNTSRPFIAHVNRHGITLMGLSQKVPRPPSAP
jgi:hypothetical protein